MTDPQEILELVFESPGAMVVDTIDVCLVFDKRIEHAPIAVFLKGDDAASDERAIGVLLLGRLAAEDMIRALTQGLDADLATHPELQPPEEP